MACNSRKIFLEVDQLLADNPCVRLYELARQLRCSHPTIEKAVLNHTSLTFREYKKKRLLEAGIAYLKEGYKAREIGLLLGYRWSENFLRLVKQSAGCSLRELSQRHSITKNTKTGMLHKEAS